MKLSQTLTDMILPIYNLMGDLPSELFTAIKKMGKRGNGTYYPTDLKRVNVILETISDLTGQHYEVLVTNGDLQSGIDWLASMLREEEHLIEFGAEYEATIW